MYYFGHIYIIILPLLNDLLAINANKINEQTKEDDKKSYIDNIFQRVDFINFGKFWSKKL